MHSDHGRKLPIRYSLKMQKVAEKILSACLKTFFLMVLYFPSGNYLREEHVLFLRLGVFGVDVV